MKQMFNEGKNSYYVRLLAEEITKNLPQKDKIAELKALHSFVRDNIRYLADPYQKELFTTPDRMARQLLAGRTVSEDCESKAVLLASLIRQIGLPSQVVIIDARADGIYSHAITRTFLNGKKINLETTLPIRMGFAPKHTKEIVIN
ncbi:MAG: transglutaminase-like domain-containing protein [Ignavibacterium sp.]|nr:transglutaminase-like domain-containing protein [Ignavibacterium sp.]